LIRVHGVPLVLYGIAMLKQAGVQEIIVATHHGAENIARELGTGEELGVPLRYSHEPMPLGSGGALGYVKRLLRGNPTVVVNADTMLNLDVERLLAWHRDQDADATMVVRPMPIPSSFSPVLVDGHDRIVAVREECPKSFQRETAIKMFTGVQVLTDAIFDYLREGYSDIISAFWHPAIADGLDLMAYNYNGPWWEVGTPHQFLKAQRESQLSEFPAVRRLVDVVPADRRGLQ
jgi:NDP-sugar pyrophosphorylase family protein